MSPKTPDIRPLSAGHASLALGVPSSVRGTIYALTITGGVAADPREGSRIVFGRNRPKVNVCIGENDRRISRSHGLLTRQREHWWVSNTGRLPVRFPDARLLFAGDEPIPLGEGYTPLFVHGSRGREHVLELYVAGSQGHRDPSRPPRTWRLSSVERLILVVLGQRYLYYEPHPQPLSWRQAADQLAELQPDAGWTAKRVEHAVVSVRSRLCEAGVHGLTRSEVGEPVGNFLNHNLIRELLASTTLVPTDLGLLTRLKESGGRLDSV